VNSERLQKFLRYTIEQTLAAKSDGLKEYALGRDVFDRGADYDPRNDSIVRVEAQRLRRKLRVYYETAGQGDPVRITFRPGGYVPTFAWSEKIDHSQNAAATGPTPSPDPHVVAVLPFSDLSPDADVEYLCDGIPEQIIHSLVSIPELRVLGR